MNPSVTMLNRDPVLFPPMNTMRADLIYCVYGFKVQDQFVWIGSDTLNHVFSNREALKNDMFAREFSTGAYVMSLELIQFHKGDYAIHMARGEAQRLINVHQPHCNTHGRKVTGRRPVCCNETGKVYANSSSAASAMGINQGNLSKHLKQTYGIKTISGYTFRYATLEEYHAQQAISPMNAEPVQSSPDVPPTFQIIPNPDDPFDVLVPPKPRMMYNRYNHEVPFAPQGEARDGQQYDWYGFPHDVNLFERGEKRRHPWQPQRNEYVYRPVQPVQPPAPPPPPPAPLIDDVPVPTTYTGVHLPAGYVRPPQPDNAPPPPRPPHGYAPGEAPTYQVTTPDGFVLDVIRESDLDRGGHSDDE